jgi:hypothetical protein
MVDQTITTLFERAKAIFDWQAGGAVQITYKKRVLLGTNAYSGKPGIGYEDDETIDVVIVETGHAGDKQIPGVVSDKQLVLFTMKDIGHLDHLVYNGEEYEVMQPPRSIRFSDKYYGKIVHAQRATGATIEEAEGEALLFSESWGYPDMPELSLLMTESWSS